MGSQFIRRSAYFAAAIVVVALTVALAANFNVRTAKAGGSPGPLYDLLSTQIVAGKTFNIYTTTPLGGVSSYVVKSTLGAGPYFVSWLGTDFICIIKKADPAQVPLCLPYSSIAAIRYH